MKRFWRRRTLIWAAPFAQPRLSVLYALFAGIILGLGSDFVFSIFREDRITPWGIRQWAGLSFIAASMLITVIASLLQSFNDHLVRSGTVNAHFAEKCDQFNVGSWGGRRLTYIVFFLFCIFFLGAIALLALEYSMSVHTLNPSTTVPCGGS
jgi:hypothetical protein